MTAARRRPAVGYVLLAAFFANLSVVCFARGDWTGLWASFGCQFLVYELWAAFTRTSGATLSERIWAWLGINPRRPWTIARRVAAGVFLAEFLLHVVTGGQTWWSGGWAIGGTAVPVAVVVAWALWKERDRG